METIADKSRTKEIIERLQTIMESASPVPLASGKVMIYKDEVQSLLTELTSQIDMELKTYHEVNDRRGKIINEAKKEAERIIYQAEHTASRMRVNKRTTNVDPVDFSMLTQAELDELDNANEIYGASLIYTDEMLTEVSNLINDTYQNMKNDYEIILNAMEEKIQILSDNRKELMAGLSEMDAKDRSQQILEIGQLLSNELFNARVNGRKNPDMYDDGSMQLSFDLKTEQEIKIQEAEAAAREAMANAKEAEAAVKEAEAAAKEAEANAKEAEEALAEMTAERDKLKEQMSKLKEENAKDSDDKAAKDSDDKAGDKAVKEESTEEKADKKEAVLDKEVHKESDSADVEDDEEYEIVYVTEDELEEGEEYEIVYVDDDEELEEESKTSAKADDKKEELEESKADGGFEGVPMIPHFKKSQKIVSVPSEKIAKMAGAMTTDKRRSGLISRAVAEREKAAESAAVTVEKDDFEITEF